MAELTRAEMGLGLFLGYLVTPKGKVIGEFRAPPEITVIPKIEIDSLNVGLPAFAVNAVTNATEVYVEICKIEVPEAGVLSLEEVSIYASVEVAYALFKIEIGATVVDDIALAGNLVLCLPFRGRVELKTGQKVALYVKTSDVAHEVKGHGAINGVIR